MPSFIHLLVVLLLSVFVSVGCGPSDPPKRAENNTPCEATPECESGYEEVEACPAGTTCEPRSLCGTTIQCRPCTAPTCPVGHTTVTSCEGRTECTSVESCGAAVYCAPPGGGENNNNETCLETPTCPEGRSPVTTCAEDADCEDVTVCETTLICQLDDAACDPDPACPNDLVKVEECANTLECERLESCDGYVYCEDADTCTAVPTCDDHDPIVENCPEGATCYDREECNETIICMGEGPTLCDGTIGCPNGYSAATPCTFGGWDECIVIEACGALLECGGSPYGEGCQAPSTCPAEWTEVEDCTTEDVCLLSERCNNLVDCVPAD